MSPLQLRVLALVAYLQLCTNQLASISQVAIAVADDEPARIIEARQCITRLLFCKRLILSVNSDEGLELGEQVMSLMTGGGNNMPLVVGYRELQAQWRRGEAATSKRQAQESLASLPTARSIYDSLSRFVIGQHDLKVALAVAGRQTLLRRVAKQQNAPALPPKPNVCVVGVSGSGKSYACRVLCQILHLPFASVDCSQLTASGYVGDDLSGCLHLLAQSAEALGVAPADGGLVHLDEVDKISSTCYSSPTTVGVQFEALRLLDGAEVSYPAHGMNKWGGYSATMDTSNLLVVCSGAFSWLAADLEGQKPKLGFADGTTAGGGQSGNLRELLATRGGLIPEILNRLSAIVRMDPLTAEDIARILLAEHGPLGEYRAMLQAEGRTLAVEPAAALAVGQWAVTTGLMGRGPKAALELLLRGAVFEGVPKEVVVTAEQVRRILAIEGAAE